MLLEEITQLLENYNQVRGRCFYLEAQIAIQERKIRYRTANLVNDNVLASVEMDGMPRGNSVSRTVENLAIRLADGWIPDDMKDMHLELEKMRLELDQKRSQVACVDAWLKALTEKQCMVIQHQMIDNESWREVGMEYKSRFGEMVSKDTLKRIKSKALDVIQALTE